MNAVARSNGVNWSAVVHPLFEAEVTVLERNRGERTAAIRRLRESKIQAQRQLSALHSIRATLDETRGREAA
jgi:hypothetical protein